MATPANGRVGWWPSLSFGASLVTRVGLTVVVLVALQIAFSKVRRGFAQSEFIPLSAELRELPLQLGSWQGKDERLDEAVFRKLAASDVVERLYSNANGDEVSVHIAAWLGEMKSFTPHSPAVCLRGAGYEVASQKTDSIEGLAGNTQNVALITAQRKDGSLTELFWYQRGEATYTNRDGGKSAHRQLWGRKNWPPIVKVLLASSAADEQTAQQSLKDVGRLVHDWLAKVQSIDGTE